MIKNYFKRNYIFNISVFIILLLITLFFVITGKYLQEGFNIKVGSVSPKKFIATKEVENELATQKLINEAKESVTPLYIHDSKVQKKVIDELDVFFKQIDKFLDELNKNDNKNNTPDAFIYQSIAPNSFETENIISSKVYLTQSQLEVLKGLNASELQDFKTSVLDITNMVLEQGIREDSENKTLSYLKEEIATLGFNEQLSNLAYIIVSSVIEPNLIVDDEATKKAKEDKAAAVKPIMILKNQKIVDEGEIISEEIYQILNSLGYIRKKSIFDNIIPIAGISFVLLVIFLSILLYLHTFHKAFCKNKREILLLSTIYIIVIFCTRILTSIPFMFVPILIFTMLISMLIDAKLAIVLNFFLTIICSYIYKGDIDFIIYFVITGTITAMTSNYTTERNKIIFVGITNAVVCAVVMGGITLFFYKLLDTIVIKNVLLAFLSGIVTLIVSIGSLPLWEAIFGVITIVKLLDLTNPNKELIRRLMIEAPGTYHHSLVVANLAEAAAYNISANPMLTRVGAYYHDIGKLMAPQYFSENIAGENPHDSMDPYNSARVIKNHVSNGIKLADEYKLPLVIKDIITQHHGNTLVKFFYYKAKEMYPNNKINENDFRYPYKTPQSKEAAVIMLADTAEAAVRSMIPSGKTMKEIEQFVDKLIKDKLDDGQLTESKLTIKDLDVISSAFMDIFKGMYHERVKYPEESNSNDDVKIYNLKSRKGKD